MNYELMEKLSELRASGALSDVDNFFKGYTGEFDLFIELTDNYDISMIRSNEGLEYISEISLDMARKYLDLVRGEVNDVNITDEELLIYSAWKISEGIKQRENNYYALYQAEDYSQNPDMVSRYDTHGSAYNKGYDHYIQDHISSSNGDLENILFVYEGQKQKSR